MQVTSAGIGEGFRYTGPTIDTPYIRGNNAQLPITKALGYVMGIKGLEAIKPTDTAGPAMTRASNLSSLTVVFLTQYKPEERQDVLAKLGGLAWAQDVLKTAKNFPGAGNANDAVRFSLALHFLVGIMDVKFKRATDYATAYLAFARIFKDAQNRRAQQTTSGAAPTGLGGLGDMVDDQNWCSTNAGTVFPAGELDKCKRCPTPVAAVWKNINSWNYQEYFGKYECASDHPKTENGRRQRGMTVPWSPPAPTGGYPMPQDIPSVDLSKFQVASCGWLGADQNRSEKAQGIRLVFKQVFGRDPNNAEVQYYGSVKWCVNPDGAAHLVDGDKFREKMVAVRTALQNKQITNTTPTPNVSGPITPTDTAIRTVGGDIISTVQSAADAAFALAEKGKNFFRDVLCAGFKKLLGDQIGGVLCDIVTFLLNSITAAMMASLNALVEMIKALVTGIGLLAQGKPAEALTAILSGISIALFSLTAPVSVPLLMGPGQTVQQGFATLNEKAKRVTQKNPLFPVVLIMAIIQVILLPTPATAANITLALAPMIAVFLGPTFAQLLNILLESAELGIERFIKLCVTVIQGVIDLKTVIPKVRGQLDAFYKKKFASGPNAKNVLDLATGVLRAFETGFDRVKMAIQQFKFNLVLEAATTLLNLVPDILAALVGEEGAKSMPSLTEWREMVKTSVANTDEQWRMLRAGAVQLLKDLPIPQQALVLIDESANLPLLDRARMAASLVRDAYKDQTTFPQFSSTFKTELLKVN